MAIFNRAKHPTGSLRPPCGDAIDVNGDDQPHDDLGNGGQVKSCRALIHASGNHGVTSHTAALCQYRCGNQGGGHAFAAFRRGAAAGFNARALVNRPPVILADEPTAPLDSVRALAVIDLLNTMARQFATAIIVVTHDEKIIPTFRRLYNIRDGVTIEERPDAASP